MTSANWDGAAVAIDDGVGRRVKSFGRRPNTGDAAAARAVVRKPPEKETAMRECVPVQQALSYGCLEPLHNFEVTARMLRKRRFHVLCRL
jgi:hypothetical protein